jgi:predicted Zn-ribbon and HTH transcriptional regulator
MADGTSDGVEGPTLEGPAASWLADRAAELGVDEETFLRRVVAAYRSVEDNEMEADLATSEGYADRLDDLADRVADVESAVDETESRVEDAEADFDEKLQDVRERVVQVKREADEKAEADHDHPDLAEDVADALAAAERVDEETAALTEDVAALTDRVDAGFENFEEVLSFLRDETDELSGKVTTLAEAVVSMREAVRTVGAAEARRARTDALKRTANVAGVEEADCEDCGQSVTVALLTAPQCPFCGAPFEDVAPGAGWFTSNTLETGATPALTAGRPWLDDDENDGGGGEAGEGSWLGAETETLEEMAAGEPADAGETEREGGDGEPVEPAEILDADGEEAGRVDGGGEP